MLGPKTQGVEALDVIVLCAAWGCSVEDVMDGDWFAAATVLAAAAAGATSAYWPWGPPTIVRPGLVNISGITKL